MRYVFAPLDEKRKFLGNFSKFLKNFLKKIAKNALFQYIFQKINKPCFKIFARLDEKHKLWGNFEKILKIFDEISIENGIFIFYVCFLKFVTKNRAIGNNTFFLQQFFCFRGGGVFAPFPLPTPLSILGTSQQVDPINRAILSEIKCSY